MSEAKSLVAEPPAAPDTMKRRAGRRPATSPDKATSATLVHDKLRQDILKGIVVPGQKLAIDAVAAMYGVGTNPVREALNRLSSERLVDRQDQRGFFVPEISLDSWRELVKTRCWLESTALTESIHNRDDRWEETIVVAFHRLSKCSPTGDAQDRAGWEIHHRAFHVALIANCGSQWLMDFCEILMDHAQRYILISAVSANRSAIEEHRVIMEVVLQGDIARAVATLVEHYQRTLYHIEEQIRVLAGSVTPHAT
ncbi:GntR family transcriptional regulator [Ancylobacter aquaticus]|uniref:GntR family transcriptional regulator n=1 Tax=Ancylobacter aquaticus TaxID=100 RepID=A0A4R1IA42_ANCAQ|nr:GntR family transcriptional regulator [Ancylobacter aquaticus]TCK30845.1 GntR family transcriptional regulator [Ancylobacter aquaticus]